MNILAKIDIDAFIFHVVHNGNAEPTLMDNTPLGRFEEFFKSRIREILDGNRFHFTQSSDFLNDIKSINDDKEKFVEVSKKLAINFHQHQDKRIKPGVMILIKAKVDDVDKFILIKYDHEGVISYTTQGTKATMEEILNTFSKNKDALQKSAVVDLNDKVVSAVIIDKSERGNVTEFFKGFLGIKRYYDSATLTKKVNDCFLETIKEHKSTLPAEFTSQAGTVFYNHAKSGLLFQSDVSIRELFGNYYSDEIGATFNKKLKQSDVQGEEFEYDKNLKKPRRKKIRTQEGVLIQYDSIAEATVEIKIEGEETKIIITTKKLIEEPC